MIGLAQVRCNTTGPIIYGLCAGLGHVTQTQTLTLHSGILRPLAEERGLFWARLPPQLTMSASIVHSLIASTFVNLTLFPAGLCWRRMSLRHCQIVEHLGRKSQRHGHLKRKQHLHMFPGKPGPDIYCAKIIRCNLLPPDLWIYKPLGHTVVKNPAANAGEMGSIPGSGRSPEEGDSNPLQCSGQRSLAGYSTRGRKDLNMTWGLNNNNMPFLFLVFI